VVIVDDEPETCELLTRALRKVAANSDGGRPI
jgi:hypothetical protein